jgi:hypothetical protein
LLRIGFALFLSSSSVFAKGFITLFDDFPALFFDSPAAVAASTAFVWRIQCRQEKQLSSYSKRAVQS